MSKHPSTQHSAALVSEADASRSMDQLRQLLSRHVSFFKVLRAGIESDVKPLPYLLRRRPEESA